MEELKKCPFCGGEATLKIHYGFEIDRNFYKRATEEMLAYERDEQMSIEDFITEDD